MNMGLFVKGVFVGSDKREFKTEDGKIKITYYVFLNTGHGVDRFSTDRDFSGELEIGDVCGANVRVRTYENKIYYYAENFEKL